MKSSQTIISGWLAVGLSMLLGSAAFSAGVVYDGYDGPGKGKHIVLIAGDQEYRAEEELPQLGKILARRHGFKCTVLFPINPVDGTIDFHTINNIPGLEALKTADVVIMAMRMLDLPDAQMKHFVDYVDSGKPFIAIRTSTHPFAFTTSKTYARYNWNSQATGWEGGFGRQILGETWINHHGDHGKQSSRAIIAQGAENHPILRGIDTIWGRNDVYGVRLPLPEGCQTLLLGQVLEGMKPTDKAVTDKKNNPMMPVAWAKTYKGKEGQTGRVFTTTMGSSSDFLEENLRRLIVNASFWCAGLEDKIPEKANVELVGPYAPSFWMPANKPLGRVRPETLEMKD
jgi:type 1 glutamine amidotransferase